MIETKNENNCLPFYLAKFHNAVPPDLRLFIKEFKNGKKIKVVIVPLVL